MKVSIIVPVYNVEPYLRQCLDSILGQTFSDYEVILVDDGSPDGCPAICDEYAAGDPRFSVIHKANGGLSSARNAALDLAKGQYVYFLDSDDIIAPELLEIAVSRMDGGADQVVFQQCRMRDDGTILEDRKNKVGTFRLLSQKDHLAYLLNTLIPCEVAWTACTSMFSMEKIRKYGQRFQDNREIFAEDMQFAICYSVHAQRIESMDDCLYYYRIREDSIMGVQQTRSNVGRLCKLAQTVQNYFRRFDDCSLLSEEFDSIYYHLIANQFTYQMWASGIAPTAYRELVRQEVTDWDTMEHQLRSFLECPGRGRSLRDAELAANVRFLLGGSEWSLRLRCRILRELKNRKRIKEES